MSELLYKNESYQIIGLCMEVYNNLGFGFLESVYQEALEQEFITNNIPFDREHSISIRYKSITLDQTYCADFVCFHKIIVELKAVKTLSPEHQAQTINYLKATETELGLLVNFGNPNKLEHLRLVNSKLN